MCVYAFDHRSTFSFLDSIERHFALERSGNSQSEQLLFNNGEAAKTTTEFRVGIPLRLDELIGNDEDSLCIKRAVPMFSHFARGM